MHKPKKNFAGYSGPGAQSTRVLKPGSTFKEMRKKTERAINKAIRDLNKIQADLEKVAEIETHVMQRQVFAHAIANIEGAIELLCEGEEPNDYPQHRCYK